VDRECYWEKGRKAIQSAARSCGIAVREGVLMWVTGPAYETPAEVRMARALGADVVAMSLAPEAIVAHRTGMKVVGLSLVTNPAVPAPGERTDHDDVIRAAQRSQTVLDQILRAGAPLLGDALGDEQTRP
jgi:purine-nucleoside phosphorylase